MILVLPAILAATDPKARGLIAWPGGKAFLWLTLLISSVVVYRFAHGFVSARALYGIAASVHAWIEVPLIVIALTMKSHASSRIPTAAEAPFAITDATNARVGDSPTAQAMIAASATTTAVSPMASADQ
jgi:hypothetical protein